MKIIVRIEDGNAILFFPDIPANVGRIVCYAAIGEHSEASRAYMRSLPKPTSSEEISKAWRALARYANSAAIK